MSKVSLEAYKADEIKFVNSLKEGAKIELENKYAYNVKYAGNNSCQGTITLESFDRSAPEDFGIRVAVSGIFTFDGGMEKERVHIATYKELFAVAKALIITLTSNAGIPPILIPTIDIESQEIYKVEPPEA